MKNLMYTTAFALLLSSFAYADIMRNEHCHHAKTCDECVNSRNNGTVRDDSKCLPIVSTKVKFSDFKRLLYTEYD
jgi:hypothetical protein